MKFPNFFPNYKESFPPDFQKQCLGEWPDVRLTETEQNFEKNVAKSDRKSKVDDTFCILLLTTTLYEQKIKDKNVKDKRSNVKDVTFLSSQQRVLLSEHFFEQSQRAGKLAVEGHLFN